MEVEIRTRETCLLDSRSRDASPSFVWVRDDAFLRAIRVEKT